MCGRFTSLLSPELLATIFEINPPPPAVEPRYNIAPTQQVWVVRSDGEHNRLDHMKWGLIPWAKDQKIGSNLINARSETVAEKPAFRHAIKYNRCIVPASGFYDWQPVGDKKQPHYFHMADDSPMALAGLWEHWKAPGEENLLETFTILTTQANELVADVHDRMPVILLPEDYSFWLNKNMHDPEQLKALYRPFPAELMRARKVSDLVNSPRFDGPSCILPV